jgi:hypothetical protein
MIIHPARKPTCALSLLFSLFFEWAIRSGFANSLRRRTLNAPFCRQCTQSEQAWEAVSGAKAAVRIVPLATSARVVVPKLVS